MSKKRPRLARPASHRAPTRSEPEYWTRRLYRNTFTYNGLTRAVNAWSVKIQLFGRRKTFSLEAGDRTRAASEACHVYQTIKTQGWDAVGRGSASIDWQTVAGGDVAVPAANSAEHWKGRLIHRRYPETADPTARREFSVRIAHAQLSRYFPLGAGDEATAVRRAMRIYRTVVSRGWPSAYRRFPRELTLAFRWLDDPLAWTYTTIHTWTDSEPTPRHARLVPAISARRVAVIEPDAGIRFALAACVMGQPGFACSGVYATTAEAQRGMVRRSADMVLVNYALPNQPGADCVRQLRRAQPALAGLLYSVFEDSDELFKSTPGGAAGYMLKRTPQSRIFDPIADIVGPLTGEWIAARIRDYFQRLVSAMPSGAAGADLARLTPREHEILALLSKGSLAKEIAQALGISIWTVHGHVKSIFEKLRVHTRTEAVVKFLQK